MDQRSVPMRVWNRIDDGFDFAKGMAACLLDFDRGNEGQDSEKRFSSSLCYLLPTLCYILFCTSFLLLLPLRFSPMERVLLDL